MVDSVAELLRGIGPCVSTELVAALVENEHIPAATARKRVSRSQDIKKLAHLPFPRNARFVYLQSDYGSPEFWTALVRALLRETSAYGGGLAALLARGGIMPRAHFAIACGAPIAQKGRLSHAAVLDRLLAAKLIQLVNVSGVGECVELSQQVKPEAYEIAALRARLRTEDILLRAIKEWARRLGLVSYGAVTLRDEAPTGVPPRVGTFHWDLTGPSYVGPMAEWTSNGPKPGFLACDVLLGVVVTVDHLSPFITKCQTLRSLKNVGRCLQIFVADSYTQDAFKLARQSGVVPATTESLFGQDVALALVQLSELLRNAVPDANKAEVLDVILSRLGRIEGAAINLRGALFEFVVAEVVRATSISNYLAMNQIFRNDDAEVEVDIQVFRRDHSIRFIECKGYKPGGTVPDDQVQRWLEVTIPFLRDVAFLERSWRGLRLEFEFWTSGCLSDAAIGMIKKAQTVRPGKYSLKVVDRQALWDVVRATNNSSLIKTVNEHYLEHPLETAGRELEKQQHRVQRRTTKPIR